MLEVIPQNITLIPNDIQRFTLRGAPPPSGWQATAGSVIIKSDGSLEMTVTTTGVGGSGFQMHRLNSGIGEATIVIDAQSKPTGANGQVFGQLTDNSLTCNINFIYDTNSIDVALSGMTGTAGTTSHTAAPGDVITMRASGSRWSILLNGVEIGYGIPTSAASYPILCQYQITNTVTTNPAHVPPVELTGDWQVYTATTWAELINNSVNVLIGGASAPYIDYKAPGLPGEYRIRAQIAASIYQQAYAAVYIAPLKIAGPLTQFVKPSQVIQFKTNYDAAQIPLVAWTAVGSGSFSGPLPGLYTAPSAVGTYVVRATATADDGNVQKDEVSVTVLTVLTPDSEPVEPGEARSNTTNMSGSLTWGATGSVALSGAGATRTWTAPSTIGQIVYINVTNGTLELVNSYEVLDVLPVNFNLPYDEPVYGPIILREVAADGRTVWARQKSSINFTPETFNVQINNMQLTDWVTLGPFLSSYYGSQKRFFIKDTAQNRRVAVRILNQPQLQLGDGGSFNCPLTLQKA